MPSTLTETQPVDVLFHLHGHTENKDREFGGWRQNKDSGEVRDVARDRIAQQIEGAQSPQLLGILPQGVNESQFGKINPDSYIADAFDRLVEIGALKQVPPKFRVVLSAHSGGGLRTVPMVAGGTKAGRPKNLAMVVLFEALSWPHVGMTKRWVRAELDALLGVLTSGATKQQKDDAVASATKLRAYFDRKDKGYAAKYDNLRADIEAWHTANSAKLGSYAAAVRDLHQVIEQGGRHEGQVRHGLGNALGGLGQKSGWSAGVSSPPTTGPAAAPGQTAPPGAGTTGAAAPPTRTLAEREAAITADMVAAQAPMNPPLARAAFVVAVAAGIGALPAAATVLAAQGVNDEINLTDALFTLVHPELGGKRIPAGREDLKRNWRTLRSTHAKPILRQAAAGKAPPGKASDSTKPGEPTVPPEPTEKPTTGPGPKAVPKPAPTGATDAESEYEAFNANIKRVFANYGGLKGYKKLRDLYAGREESAGNAAGWLNQLEFGTPFCGTKLDGIHPTLSSALSKVDERCTELAAQVRAAKVEMKFEGKFQPRVATVKERKLSDHALGLALHLNYKSNPFVGRNKAATKIIEEIAAAAGQDKFWKSVSQGGKSQKAIRSAYEAYAKASDAVAAYFKAADVLAKAEQAGTLDADGKAELAKRRKEEAILRATDFAMSGGATRDPRQGFFAHTANVDGDPMWGIIEQLTTVAKLQWGGMYGGGKDLHHFALKS